MPIYTDNILNEVRNSVNIVAVISEYVPLRKRGRNHVARCPFHNEKTAHFNVNEERQVFHCFGCGLGGDVFRFLMEIERFSFPEAVQFFAKRQGITLPAADTAPAVSEGFSVKFFKNHIISNTFIKQGENELIPQLYVISGHSGAGKTKLVNELFSSQDNAIIMTSEKVIDDFMFFLRRLNNSSDAIKVLFNRLINVKYYIIEDIDFLEGKSMIMEFMASLFNKLIENGTVVLITGIDVKNRVSTLLQRVSLYSLIEI